MSALASTIQNYMYDTEKFSKTKRNFIKENMKQIKKMQVDAKEKNGFKKAAVKKTVRKEEEKASYVQKKLHEPRPTKEEIEKYVSKEQGSQTSSLDLNGSEIRFPKARAKTPPPPDGKKNLSIQVDPMNDLVYKSHEAVAILAPSHLPVKEDGKVDFVRLNMFIAPKKKPSPGSRNPHQPPPSYQRGVVPKYLREAKKQQIEEVQEKGLVEVIDETDEKSYTQVTEEEKKERLREIRLAYAQLVTELNTLPFRSDSPKIQAQREEIESTLRKLEDGIKLFSREKLYLKVS